MAPPSSSSPSSPLPPPSADALAADFDIGTLPTWVCLRGGGANDSNNSREVARVQGVRHKRPLQPVAAAVRRRLLLLPQSEEEEQH